MAAPRALKPAEAGGVAGALTAASAGSVTALDAASELKALKIVRTARQIGANTTLYEVSPGDTVTLRLERGPGGSVAVQTVGPTGIDVVVEPGEQAPSAKGKD